MTRSPNGENTRNVQHNNILFVFFYGELYLKWFKENHTLPSPEWQNWTQKIRHDKADIIDYDIQVHVVRIAQ